MAAITIADHHLPHLMRLSREYHVGYAVAGEEEP